jgi:hypothetical protein
MLAPIDANESVAPKTVAITADAIDISAHKVERARAVLPDPEEAAVVRRGEKTIYQAAESAKAKRAPRAYRYSSFVLFQPAFAGGLFSSCPPSRAQELGLLKMLDLTIW